MVEGVIENIAENTGGVVSKAYDDVVHPTAAAVGAMLSYPFRGIRVLCGKYEKWLINGEESLHIVGEAVHKKMEKVPPEKQCVPDAYVAIPTIQQICLAQDSEDLREMYTNLLVSSMNTDTKHKVLPSYVNIIGQLSPDEARLLRYMSEKVNIPALEVRASLSEDKKEEFVTSKDCYVEISDGIIEISDNLNSYIENLQRLKLIKLEKDRYLVNKTEEYNKLIQNFKDEAKEDSFLKDKYLSFQKEILKITLFGIEFNMICS